MYEFKKEDAYEFARHIGAKTSQRGDELIFKVCPFCHADNREDKGKFSINLNTGQFNCFRASCAAKGNMITLSRAFDFPLPGFADEYVNHRKKYIRFKSSVKPVPTDPAIEYLKSRGISEDVARQYSITTKPENPDILLIPFYDENNVLQLIKYRNTKATKENGMNKEWSFKNGEISCKPILFGMNHCDPNEADGTLVITEGQMDTLAAVTAGVKNVVSVPTGANGFTWIPYCWDFMRQFKTLVVFGDYENGKITLLEDMKKYFQGQVMYVKPENYLGEKDANAILQKYGAEAVQCAVSNAEKVKPKGLVKMKDVQRIEVGDLQKINTGFLRLNSLLGGFYDGQLIVLSGTTGSGKSTLASQFALHAVKAGVRTFFYSGELQNWQIRNWFEFQAAGKVNVLEETDGFGFQSYRLKPGVKERVEKWYGDLVDLYDNTELESEDAEHESIESYIDKAIKDGNRVLIVDNLMTAMDEYNGDDFYKAQTNFIRRLSVKAKRNNVIIILVAHFKKTNGLGMNIESVSGSSNIVNLADVVLTFRKPTERELAEKQCSRKLEVLKNRIFGRVGTIDLWYEEKSRRLSERPDWFDFNVLGNDDFVNTEEDDDIDISEIFPIEE